MELKELQKIELDILKWFDGFCKKNNLEYFLAAGTLIGAVRHKGFIPWDDDIDVFMKREDYMKLVECAEKDPDSRYKVLSIYNSKDWYMPYIKVVDTQYKCEYSNDIYKPQKELCLWIDVFPLDYYDEKINSFKKLYFKKKIFACTAQNKLYFGVESRKSFIRKTIKSILYFIFHNKNPQKYALKVDKEAQKCKHKTDKLFFANSSNPEKNFFADWFNKTVDLKFEDEFFSCPEGYDAVLRSFYGDYMQLPPEEDRICKHKIIIEKKDENL